MSESVELSHYLSRPPAQTAVDFAIQLDVSGRNLQEQVMLFDEDVEKRVKPYQDFADQVIDHKPSPLIVNASWKLFEPTQKAVVDHEDRLLFRGAKVHQTVDMHKSVFAMLDATGKVPPSAKEARRLLLETDDMTNYDAIHMTGQIQAVIARPHVRRIKKTKDIWLMNPAQSRALEVFQHAVESAIPVITELGPAETANAVKIGETMLSRLVQLREQLAESGS